MRYAIYYSPHEESLLHQLGASWLGYDAYKGKPTEQPGNGLLNAKTDAASLYGFHATLKPPFFLKPDANAVVLTAAVAELTHHLKPTTIDRLVLKSIDGFLALVPENQSSEIDFLAACCVSELDHYREEPSDAELIRRRSENLSARQHRYLTEWGYPYVFEEFKFHMTLTRRLEATEHDAVFDLANNYFADVIDRPLDIEALTIFTQA